jgi:hypothetical protein
LTAGERDKQQKKEKDINKKIRAKEKNLMFEILTAVVMKSSSVFRDISPCNPHSTDVSEEQGTACHLLQAGLLTFRP